MLETACFYPLESRGSFRTRRPATRIGREGYVSIRLSRGGRFVLGEPGSARRRISGFYPLESRGSFRTVALRHQRYAPLRFLSA